MNAEQLQSLADLALAMVPVATDGITAPIWFGQGADPEIRGVVTVGVHHQVD